jgi:hypothetical protein
MERGSAKSVYIVKVTSSWPRTKRARCTVFIGGRTLERCARSASRVAGSSTALCFGAGVE